MTGVEWLMTVLGVYTAIGIVIAIVFVLIGITRHDKAARISPKRFRLIVFPGCVALWPVILIWLLRLRSSEASA